MEWMVWVMYAIVMLPVMGFVGYMFYTRSKYKNKANAGAFFFEDGKLVLNSGLPYAVPYEDVERVELHYNLWELEHMLSYNLRVKLIQKSGKTRTVFYKGYKTAKLATPADMKAALEEKGIRCVEACKGKQS